MANKKIYVHSRGYCNYILSHTSLCYDDKAQMLSGRLKLRSNKSAPREMVYTLIQMFIYLLWLTAD